jgi:thioredoxin-like negative regulator of GroEL
MKIQKYPDLKYHSKEDVLCHRGLSMVLIYGERCPPCVRLCHYLSQKKDEKTYGEIIEETLADKLKCNVIVSLTEYESDFKELIDQQRIRSIPTMLLVKDGTVLGHFSGSVRGAMNNFLDDLKKFPELGL